jgi:hypothetical protein
MIVEYANDPNKTKKENRQAKREFKQSQRQLNRNSAEAIPMVVLSLIKQNQNKDINLEKVRVLVQIFILI